MNNINQLNISNQYIKLYPEDIINEKILNELKSYAEKYNFIIDYYKKTKIENISIERHHIIPKSIDKTKSKEKDNIVELPLKMHFIVHCLLPLKYLEENNKNGYIKMCRALDRFFTSKPEVIDFEKNSNEYAFFRELSICKGEKNPWYGRKHKEESKQKMSQKRKGMVSTFLGKHHSEDSKIKMSINRKGKTCGEKNPMFGKSSLENKSKEEILKIKEKRKNTWKNKDCEFMEKYKNLQSEINKNLRWYTNGIKNIRISKDSDVPEGYFPGVTKKS